MSCGESRDRSPGLRHLVVCAHLTAGSVSMGRKSTRIPISATVAAEFLQAIEQLARLYPAGTVSPEPGSRPDSSDSVDARKITVENSST